MHPTLPQNMAPPAGDVISANELAPSPGRDAADLIERFGNAIGRSVARALLNSSPFDLHHIIAGDWTASSSVEVALRVPDGPASDDGLVGRLSPQVYKVAKLAADGALNKQIAAALGITEATVKVHIRTAFKVLGINRRTALLKAFAPVGSDAQKEPGALLSPREERCLEQAAKGLSNKEIGRALGIDETAVKIHMRGVLVKLEMSNRTQAARWYLARRTAQQSAMEG